MILTRPPAVIALRSKQYFVFPRIYPFERHTVEISFSVGLDSSCVSQEHVPCSLFFFRNLEHLEQGLSQAINKFVREDDVFCEDFLENILISFPNKNERAATVSPDIFRSFGTKTVSTVVFSAPSTLPPGPYFLQEGGVSQAWRCYTDPLAAFVRPIVPVAGGSKFEDPGIPLYPVPSRLFSEPKSESKPLSGLRFAVKDVIDIAGVPTTNCCRAYEDLHGLATHTAPVV